MPTPLVIPDSEYAELRGAWVRETTGQTGNLAFFGTPPPSGCPRRLAQNYLPALVADNRNLDTLECSQCEAAG